MSPQKGTNFLPKSGELYVVTIITARPSPKRFSPGMCNRSFEESSQLTGMLNLQLLPTLRNDYNFCELCMSFQQIRECNVTNNLVMVFWDAHASRCFDRRAIGKLQHVLR